MFAWKPNANAPLWDASDPGEAEGPYFSNSSI